MRRWMKYVWLPSSTHRPVWLSGAFASPSQSITRPTPITSKLRRLMPAPYLGRRGRVGTWVPRYKGAQVPTHRAQRVSVPRGHHYPYPP